MDEKRRAAAKAVYAQALEAGDDPMAAMVGHIGAELSGSQLMALRQAYRKALIRSHRARQAEAPFDEPLDVAIDAALAMAGRA